MSTLHQTKAIKKQDRLNNLPLNVKIETHQKHQGRGQIKSGNMERKMIKHNIENKIKIQTIKSTRKQININVLKLE